ncbi:disulfide bond formation protein B [Acetobacteraceae bacterium ESL0709]|nr:disulfide bond formation protein B [Acetobacteraceae bacterium ESL0697]MDF7677189.1 disulfide bond formation protein B [Acetobacteraceae bacterium ESL0709]
MLMTRKREFRRVRALGGLFVLSGLAALLAAHGAERFLHMVPCELCLWERRPWRVLISLGALTLVLSPRYARWPVIGGLVCLAISVGLSVLHIGVEHNFWPSPAPSCHVTVTHAEKVSDWLSRLPAAPVKPCDQPDFPFGLPMSMVTISGLYTLVIFLAALKMTVRIFRRVNRDQKREYQS